MGEVIIRHVNLPCRVKGFVKEDYDGNYNIYININHNLEIQHRTLCHELRHIEADDFNNDFDVSKIEMRKAKW